MNAENRGRVAFLDDLRGLCLMAMVVYHLFFIMGFLFDMERGMELYNFFSPVQPIFGALFILIAGVCTQFSGRLAKRGLILLACAAAISVATIVLLPRIGIDMPVWFGILHMLAIAKLLSAAGGRALLKIPAIIGLLLSAALFFYTFTASQGYLSLFGYGQVALPAWLFEHNWLLPLGFHSPNFFMWDYFPLVPFLFIFLFGAFLGKMVGNHLPTKSLIPPLGFWGRHSLVIYLLHMPLIYGIIYLIDAVILSR